MEKKISLLVMRACQKIGINYTSPNIKAVEFYNDATRLGEIIWSISCLISELNDICERHKITNGLKETIQEDLEKLHDVDHDLFKLATEIKKEN